MMNNEKCSDKKQEITKQNSKHNFIQTTVKKRKNEKEFLDMAYSKNYIKVKTLQHKKVAIKYTPTS